MHEKIYSSTLIEIIQDFFKSIKIISNLKYPDVERTGTGSVRCKTNLRFAVYYIRELGLINYHEKGRRAWSLTLPGFLTAAHICLNNPFEDFPPYSFTLKKLAKNPSQNYYLKIDDKLKTAFDALSDTKNLNYIFEYIEDISFDKGLTQISQEIFKDYSELLLNLKNLKEKKKYSRKELSKEIANFIEHRNKKYNIEIFKVKFSDLINADRFFNEVINKSYAL